MAKNSETFKMYNTWYSQDREQYRRFAESKRNQTVFKQERLTEVYDRGRAYIIEQQEKGEPLTVSGLQLACRCNRTDFKRMRHHEYDWRRYQFMDYKGIQEEDLQLVRDDLFNRDVEYWTDEDGVIYVMNTYSEVIEWFYLQIQKQLEIACYQNRNPAGSIFLLKSQFGWDDKQQTRVEKTAPVHVATAEEAKNALKRLTDR